MTRGRKLASRIAAHALLAACVSTATVLAVGSAAHAQGPVTVPESESHALEIPALGQVLEISIAFPRGYSTSDTIYPTLYVLDANLMFGTVTESLRSMNISGAARPALVVGIGYPFGRFFNTMGRRALDLTPTRDGQWEDEQATLYPEFPTPVGTGGASRFLGAVVDQVIPLVEQRYRSDPEQRVLIGHSFSGLFVLYTLFNRPDVFNGYLASSPSLWWDDAQLFSDAERYARRAERPSASVFLSVGAEELLPQYSMIGNASRMAAVLGREDLSNVRLHFRIIDGAGHNAAIPIAMSYGLRALLPR
jgi:predicted alpha/beta superfamily hydrolase